MPAYNAEKTIDKSIESILKQTDQDFEIIVVDDASLDNTRNIVNKYIDSRIKLIVNERNLGVAESRNRAIVNANGKYIAFLDSDDVWDSKKLETQRKLFEKGHLVLCSAYKKMDALGNVNDKKIFHKKIITYSDMLKSNFIGNLTGAYNCDSLGKFFQKKMGHEDYIMWLEIIKVAKYAYCSPECLAYYRVISKSLSSNKIKAMMWQFSIYRKVLKMNFITSFFYFFFYTFHAIRKRA